MNGVTLHEYRSAKSKSLSVPSSLGPSRFGHFGALVEGYERRGYEQSEMHNVDPGHG